jgi:hypothetical protein
VEGKAGKGKQAAVDNDGAEVMQAWSGWGGRLLGDGWAWRGTRVNGVTRTLVVGDLIGSQRSGLYIHWGGSTPRWLPAAPPRASPHRVGYSQLPLGRVHTELATRSSP